MSVVAASISLSSDDRSVKPGRTCFACNLSRAATEREKGKETRDLGAVERKGVRVAHF